MTAVGHQQTQAQALGSSWENVGPEKPCLLILLTPNPHFFFLPCACVRNMQTGSHGRWGFGSNKNVTLHISPEEFSANFRHEH